MTSTSELAHKLHYTTDASIWASEFCKLNPSMDEGTMIGWFANAIVTTQDLMKQQSGRTYKVEQVVYLNSGGPELTVVGYIEDTGDVVVKWKSAFNGSDQKEVLPEDCICLKEPTRRVFYIDIDNGTHKSSDSLKEKLTENLFFK